MAAGLHILVALLLVQTPEPRQLSGVVVDEQGGGVAGARVRAAGREHPAVEVRTHPDGSFEVAVPAVRTVRLEVSAEGFVPVALQIGAGGIEPIRVQLARRGLVETVTVTSSADGLRVGTPGSVTSLDAELLASMPTWTLDDQLRSVPGFSLFRRSSSRVANPTTQGVTLRGFAASGASRSAVFADGMPLNDPFGGWVYWNRVPAASIERVEVARGGTSDLFGSDAMGGAIRISTFRTHGARVWLDGGSHGSARVSAHGGLAREAWSAIASVEASTSDGFVIVAPEARGPIDVRAFSQYVTTRAALGLPPWRGATFGVRGGYFTEDRGNGTPFQINATIVRHVAASASGALGGGAWSARATAGSQGYDQTFSAVAPDRGSERPTTVQHVESEWLDGAFEWIRAGSRWTVLLGGSARDVAADLREAPAATPSATALIAVQQQSAAMTAQASLQPTARVTVGIGARGELWTSEPRAGAADGGQTRRRVVPRLSVAWQVSDLVSIRGMAHGAYRTPTINELYRPFRVGNILTQANASLDPERTAGVEGALLVRGRLAAFRTTGFWTRLNDAIVNVTLETTPALILRQRQNAGTIRARGIEIEADARLTRLLWLSASGAWIDSTFIEGTDLAGLRVPQVPDYQAAVALRADWSSLSGLVEWRYVGSQYDDDRNQFLLDASGIVNARAGWRPRRGLEVFAAVENALDEDQDVGRTPVRTIGTPRTLRVGLRWTR